MKPLPQKNSIRIVCFGVSLVDILCLNHALYLLNKDFGEKLESFILKEKELEYNSFTKGSI